MNALDLDAMTLHWEFAHGPVRVRQLAAGLAYPAMAINIYDYGTLEHRPDSAAVSTVALSGDNLRAMVFDPIVAHVTSATFSTARRDLERAFGPGRMEAEEKGPLEFSIFEYRLRPRLRLT